MEYSSLRRHLESTRPDLDLSVLDRAYFFAEKAHAGQERYSGEAYLTHPVAVAHIVSSLQVDSLTLQIALLHDVMEGTSVTVADLEQEFGKEIAGLIQAFDKLSLIKIRPEDSDAEKWKRMFLALSKDVRLVFVKLAERLHNMRTLEFVPVAKRERIARESLLVHAALASRLGLYAMKSELEDLAFRYLYPQAFLDLSQQVEGLRAQAENGMEYAMTVLEKTLLHEGIRVEKVQGRFKHLWSIFQKLELKQKGNIDSLYDLFAVRVLLPDVILDEEEDFSHVYSALSVIHGLYAPIPGRFKDYVAVPKPNGYRSLHTTVLGLGATLYEHPTEVQIRTVQMHREAELGVASHWSYKLGASARMPLDAKAQKKVRAVLQKIQGFVKKEPDLYFRVEQWLEDYQHMLPVDRLEVERQLLDGGVTEEELVLIRKSRAFGALHLREELEEQLAWIRGLADSAEERVELDLYSDRISILTPQRDVVELSRGATPIDFAYMVHSEVGHKMVGAKVNGRIVPLDYVLQTGEMVEVLTRANAKPNRYWYSMAQTSVARNKIRNWFNQQDREINVATGRLMVNKALAQLGKAPLDEKLTLLKDYGGKERNFADREQLIENVGLERVTAFQIVKTLFPEETVSVPKIEEISVVDSFENKVTITGQNDLPVILSACCQPKCPQPIVGYVTRGHFIRVHRLSCRELSNMDGARFVEAQWQAS